MKKIYWSALVSLSILAVYFVALSRTGLESEVAKAPDDFKNTTYSVDGEMVTLVDGISEVQIPDSTSKIITRYFGNEIYKDINGDGKEDVVFLLTQETGGSGVFYYAAPALKTEDGYVGAQALFLGDRIAPQTTESGPGRQVIINYADRAYGESFDVSPSVGKSIYLLFDVEYGQFGEVVQNFEGESADGSGTDFQVR
jgi:hypothetical protein